MKDLIVSEFAFFLLLKSVDNLLGYVIKIKTFFLNIIDHWIYLFFLYNLKIYWNMLLLI